MPFFLSKNHDIYLDESPHLRDHFCCINVENYYINKDLTDNGKKRIKIENYIMHIAFCHRFYGS